MNNIVYYTIYNIVLYVSVNERDKRILNCLYQKDHQINRTCFTELNKHIRVPALSAIGGGGGGRPF